MASEWIEYSHLFQERFRPETLEWEIVSEGFRMKFRTSESYMRNERVYLGENILCLCPISHKDLRFEFTLLTMVLECLD